MVRASTLGVQFAALIFASSLAGCSSSSTPANVPRQDPTLSVSRPDITYACPAQGDIEYVSDYNNNVINVYAGRFHRQAPCGQLTDRVFGPWGMYVQPSTHDLYVANDLHHDVIVFHRGHLTPYNTYTDPTLQDPTDVTVADDGTVIASNLDQIHFSGEHGSLSTWKSGTNGGTFV